MEKKLFVKVSKLAHKLTREYKAKFNDVSYMAQYGIFFKLVVAVMKAKEKLQKVIEVKQHGVLKTLYAMGTGANIKCYLTDLNNPPTNDTSKWFSIWKLPVGVIMKLI